MRIIIVDLTCSTLENEDTLGAIKGALCFWNKQTLERKGERLNNVTQPHLFGSHLSLFLCKINENLSLFVILDWIISLSS